MGRGKQGNKNMANVLLLCFVHRFLTERLLHHVRHAHAACAIDADGDHCGGMGRASCSTEARLAHAAAVSFFLCISQRCKGWHPFNEPCGSPGWEQLNTSCKVIISAGLRFTLAKGILATFFLLRLASKLLRADFRPLPPPPLLPLPPQRAFDLRIPCAEVPARHPDVSDG